MKHLSETQYQKEADKLADIEQRVANLETELHEAIEAAAAKTMPEPGIGELSLDELIAPIAVAVAPLVKTRRDLDVIRKDIARWERAAELQLPIVAKARAAAVRAAIAELAPALSPIAERAAVELRKALAIAQEADSVLATFTKGGFAENAFLDDPDFKESHMAARDFIERIDAVKDVPMQYLRRLKALGLLK